MSKNSAEHLLKVQHAAQFLVRAPQAGDDDGDGRG
jgi:hypothetical protein